MKLLNVLQVNFLEFSVVSELNPKVRAKARPNTRLWRSHLGLDYPATDN
ncbi:hypothetical protein NK6_3277 [Bradyrhizobium diazoefficiens]|uniref:Uncharacterized protein n=1 Tax=Bradyrhizobium diazoefficiens TaxID=1355477 RepID=A0A0E3VTY2_9BRAD|nr:hypothetical protein NK6_3277 [Bradyrhizobium diazoefficiens]